jgi:hypothetical protein
MAIALDRQGTTDVITHQSWGRCCSDTFALALAAALGTAYRPVEGVYTDTAEYVNVIPECTNISVGYYHQHTAWEYLDSRYLFRLLNVLLKLDTTKLPIVRDPLKAESKFEDWDDDFNHQYGRYDYPLWWTDQEIADHLSELDRGDRIESLSSSDSAYLDPVFADVQQALKDAGMIERGLIDKVAQSYYRKKTAKNTVVFDMHDSRRTSRFKDAARTIARSDFRQILPGIVIKETKKEGV